MKTYYNSKGLERQDGCFMSNEDFEITFKKIKEDLKFDFVIIDGEDDFTYPRYIRPQKFVPKEFIQAYYHSGFSGITKSGVIVKESDFKEIEIYFNDKFELDINFEYRLGKNGCPKILNIIHSNKIQA